VSAEPGRSLDRVADIIWVLKGRGMKERKHQTNKRHRLGDIDAAVKGGCAAKTTQTIKAQQRKPRKS
jgi:hypothetical protein